MEPGKFIEIADWDSSFFGYPVGRIRINEESLDHLPGIIEISRNNGYRLLYFIAADVEKFSKEFLHKIMDKMDSIHARLTDKKVFARLEISKPPPCLPANVSEFRPGMNEEKMIDLALQCGEYSRFKNDKGFKNHEFERMYAHWIRSSIQGRSCDQVFISTLKDTLTGLITLSKKDTYVNIDLIGVDQPERGKGIAKTLLDAARYYAGIHNVETIRLSTQEDNKPAMGFYSRHGFHMYQVDYIFHVWL